MCYDRMAVPGGELSRRIPVKFTEEHPGGTDKNIPSWRISMIVITGATGNIGSKIALNLLTRGQRVLLIGRHEDKLRQASGGRGAISAGNLTDKSFLTDTMTGAEAVFAMIPPDYTAADSRRHQNEIAESLAEAIQKSGVRYIVTLSSIGAHRPDRTGIVGGLYDFEQTLNTLEGVNIIHLRSGYFMENIFTSLETIRSLGAIALPLDPDREFPMIATRDVAYKAAEYLTNRNFTGKQVQYLLGPRDYTYHEVTGILSKALNKPDLKYYRVSPDVALQALKQMGISDSVAQDYIGLMNGINNGFITEDVKRTPETTTPTTLEEFSETLATVYADR